MHKAAKNCHFTVVQELLQFIQGFIGVCHDYVNKKNNKGETALHYAAMISKNLLHYPDEDKMILRMLMENGADVTVLTELNKESAFHYVSLSGDKHHYSTRFPNPLPLVKVRRGTPSTTHSAHR